MYVRLFTVLTYNRSVYLPKFSFCRYRGQLYTYGAGSGINASQFINHKLTAIRDLCYSFGDKSVVDASAFLIVHVQCGMQL